MRDVRERAGRIDDRLSIQRARADKIDMVYTFTPH